MTEMVERVAEALMAVPLDEKNSDFYAMARAAIEAMREPTEAMTTAGWEPSNNKGPYHCWAAMIDAALKVKP